MKKFIFSITFNFLLVTICLSQIKIHRTLSVEDGLVQSQVTCLYEDQNGYMWFGTYGGLSRWDGIEFVNFHTNDGLIENRVFAILQGVDSTLYFGACGGITALNQDRFQRLTKEDHPLELCFTTFCESRDSSIYLGSSHGVYIYKNNKIEQFGKHLGLDTLHVTSIIEDKKGNLYFGTVNNGVVIQHDSGFRLLDELVNKRVTSLFAGKDNRIYIGTTEGIRIYHDGRLTHLTTAEGLISANIRCIGEGDDGTMFFGTPGSGVYLFKDGRIDNISVKNGLSSNYILSIYKASDGTIYLGTNGGGVCLYKAGRFETFNETVGLADNIVMAIAEHPDGSMLFGSMNNGVSIYHDGQFRYINETNGLSFNRVINICIDENGRTYIATDNGITIYHKGRFSYINKKYGLPSNEITAILIRNSRELFIGTYDHGVVIYCAGQVSFLNEKNGLSDDHIVSLAQDKDGVVYIGTGNGGVCLYAKGKIQQLTTHDGLVHNNVVSIYAAENGVVYFGTENGLSIYQKNNFKSFGVQDGLSNGTINGICEDLNGRIYLTTNKGVNVLDFSSGGLEKKIILHSDGLASDECNQGAIYRDRRGRMWFGTINGVTCYDPQKDIPRAAPPKIHFTKIRLFDETIPLFQFLKKRRFSYKENYFKFDFIGLNLSMPQSIVYQYRLTGLDADWLQTNQRSVQYTNLNDGNYTFEAKARNEWDNWSKPISVTFEILPPFWEKWWFITLLIIALAGSIAYLVTFKFRQLLLIERLRTKIAADLHDMIGSGLTEISILSEVVNRNLDQTSEKVSKNLLQISDISRSLVDSMSDIVWLVNPQKDTLFDLIIRLKDSYTEMLSGAGIAFKTGDLRPLERIALPMEYRHNIYLILKEGINNSIKHSGSQEISLDVRVSGKKLELILRDDGRGFNPKANKSSNGLNNMQRRAQKIGGTLHIIPIPEKGTTIQFIGRIS